MTRMTTATRTRACRSYLTGADRDQAQADIAELNAEGLTDSAIGHVLDLPRHVVRYLRDQAGIPAVPRPAPGSTPPRRINDGSQFLRDCPACGLSVDVRRDTVEDHQRFTEEFTEGLVNGLPVHAVAPCEASGGSYTQWLKGTPA